MKKQALIKRLPIIVTALAVSLGAVLPSLAHERIRFDENGVCTDNCQGGNGIAGEIVSGAIGNNNEPSFEDEINGFDFFLFYEDGSADGNVISTGDGDKVTFEFVDFLQLEDDAIDAQILNQQPMPTPRETFSTQGRYQNKVRYVDDGTVGYIVKACVQDLVEQEDDNAADPYEPMDQPICFEHKSVCGQGSQDPRNNEGDPEFDGGFHQFSCVADAPPFGATSTPEDAHGKDKQKDKDRDQFSDPTPPPQE